jgi:hypothetical protein
MKFGALLIILAPGTGSSKLETGRISHNCPFDIERMQASWQNEVNFLQSGKDNAMEKNTDC